MPSGLLGYAYAFQSALPLRGATIRLHRVRICHAISIRAPLAGSDGAFMSLPDLMRISIRAPLAGSDRIQ